MIDWLVLFLNVSIYIRISNISIHQEIKLWCILCKDAYFALCTLCISIKRYTLLYHNVIYLKKLPKNILPACYFILLMKLENESNCFHCYTRLQGKWFITLFTVTSNWQSLPTYKAHVHMYMYVIANVLCHKMLMNNKLGT